MLDNALFVSDEVQPRQVTLADGTEHTLHFRQVPAATFRRYHIAVQSGDEDAQATAMAKLIAASLCEPDGKPAITVQQALRLKPAAERAITDAVLAVNGLGDPAPGKDSQPGASSISGTSSPSHSAEERSPNGSA